MRRRRSPLLPGHEARLRWKSINDRRRGYPEDREETQRGCVSSEIRTGSHLFSLCYAPARSEAQTTTCSHGERLAGSSGKGRRREAYIRPDSKRRHVILKATYMRQRRDG